MWLHDLHRFPAHQPLIKYRSVVIGHSAVPGLRGAELENPAVRSEFVVCLLPVCHNQNCRCVRGDTK